MTPEPLVVDVTLTWLAALGLLAFVIHVHRRPKPSFMEKRIRLLLYCLFLILVARGFAWLYPGPWTTTLRFVPSTVFPLALTVFAEGLLRRHVPLFAKVLVAFGTLTFFIGNLFGKLHPGSSWMLPFTVYFTGMIVVVAALLWLRKHEALSPAENRLIDALTLVALVAGPLVLTDFVEFPGFRLGSLAALVFVCTCLRTNRRRDGAAVLLGQLLRFFGRSTIIALVLLFSWQAGAEAWLAALAIGAAIVLTFSSWNKTRVLDEHSREQSFLKWILDAEVQSLPIFLDTLSGCPVTEDHRVIGCAQLGEFGPEALGRRLLELGCVQNVRDLKERARGTSASTLDADEQLLSLLETYGMTHIFLVDPGGPIFLLLNYPQIADGSVAALEMDVVQKLARLASAGEQGNAAEG